MITSLLTWLNIPDHRESRRFLEAHVELLTRRSKTTQEQMIADARANPTDQIVTNNEQKPCNTSATIVRWCGIAVCVAGQ